MSCETLYVTGVVREDMSMRGTLVRTLHLSSTIEEQDSVIGLIPPFELTAVVGETIVITGKCRPA